MHKIETMKDACAHQYHTLKNVHSSAMYYQNLNVIHEPSEKLLEMKSM